MRTSWHEATGQTWDLPVPAQGASTHARFFDPAGPPSLAISCLAVLPSAFETASAPGNSDFVAQWLAYALPYRRFVDVLANGNARLGADVVRYAFIVSDFHRLLLAGLPAHFESDMPPATQSVSARRQSVMRDVVRPKIRANASKHKAMSYGWYLDSIKAAGNLLPPVRSLM